MLTFRATGIRSQLIRAFGVLLLLSVLLAGVNFWAFQNMRHYHRLELSISQIQTLMEDTRKNERTFLLLETKEESFYRNRESHNHQLIKTNIALISQQLEEQRLASYAQLSAITQTLEHHTWQYLGTFDTLVAISLERGYKDFGMIGSLRKAIHQVEDMPYDYDKAGMLMLRRHEKDFLLRRDLKYEAKFKEAFQSFRSKVASHLASQTQQSDNLSIFLASLDNYRDGFLRVVQVEQRIGLDYNSGILAELEKQATILEANTKQMAEIVKWKSEYQQKVSYFATVVIFALQFIVSLFIALRFSYRLSKRIRILQSHIRELSLGRVPSALPIQGQDELSDAGISLNQLTEGIHCYVQFAASVGKGDFSSSFAKLSDEDQLGTSLLTMQSDLRAALEKEKQRNFIAEEVSSFVALIHRQPLDLYDQLLSRLVKSLRAGLGGLFIHSLDEEGQSVLSLAACYAYGRKKYVSKNILPGEGLVGQTFLEKEKILLTEIPPEYPWIKSGLGNAKPVCLLIMPLLTNEKIVGILELASFSVFEEHQIALAEQVGGAVASAIQNHQYQEEMARLAQTSREQRAFS